MCEQETKELYETVAQILLFIHRPILANQIINDIFPVQQLSNNFLIDYYAKTNQCDT